MEYGALDSETIADLLGVTTRQISNYCKQKGLPSHGEGRQRTFIWQEVREWYVDYRKTIDRNLGSAGSPGSGNAEETSVPDLKHSEARRAKYVADTREIELQQKLGQLIAIDDAVRILQDVAKGLQTEILGMPSRIVEQVLVLRDRAELFSFLTAESSALCTRLSTLRIGSAEEIADAAAPEGEDDEDDDE